MRSLAAVAAPIIAGAAIGGAYLPPRALSA
jgi:hypothetical protein